MTLESAGIESGFYLDPFLSVNLGIVTSLQGPPFLDSKMTILIHSMLDSWED